MKRPTSRTNRRRLTLKIANMQQQLNTHQENVEKCLAYIDEINKWWEENNAKQEEYAKQWAVSVGGGVQQIWIENWTEDTTIWAMWEKKVYYLKAGKKRWKPWQ